jgi:flagellar biosynthetic protein FlhB
MADAQEKTEKPTGKRLTEARNRGQVAVSREATTLVVLFASVALSIVTYKEIFRHFQEMVWEIWGSGFEVGSHSILDGKLLMDVGLHITMMMGPFIFGLLVVGVIVNLVQLKGLTFAAEAIKPSLDKLNFVKGLARFFSLRSLTQLLKNVCELGVICFAVYKVIESNDALLPLLVDQDVASIMKAIGVLSLKVTVIVCLSMLPICAFDFYYQRWQHQKDLRMTKQEVKEENKQSEGDPKVKSKIRSIQMTLARKRMMADVPKADVVITNPTHFAVALEYKAGMEAPKVLAKGMNRIAKNVIKKAREHGVPVVQNPPLARALYKQANVGDTIPTTLYKAVAKVLAYIYQQRGRSIG